MYLKGTNSVAMSGLGLRRPWLALCGLFLSPCMIGLRKQPSHLVAPALLALKIFTVWTGSYWLRAKTTGTFLMSGCG